MWAVLVWLNATHKIDGSQFPGLDFEFEALVEIKDTVPNF